MRLYEQRFAPTAQRGSSTARTALPMVPVNPNRRKCVSPRWRLDRHREAVGQPLSASRRKRGVFGPAVELALSLDGIELLDLTGQSLGDRQAGPIQHVGPSGRRTTHEVPMRIIVTG